jgi:tetratricopeptide (TPR) repeat protein
MAVAVTLCMCGALPLFAAPDAGVAAPDIEARRQVLLRSMLQDPSNLDVAFEYASLSSQVGDYEAAISTLERMLIFAPNTPRLQLELGILYYKLGSYEVARSYFAQVVANPSVPQEIAAKVRLYLQQLAIEAEPPAFAGSIFSGIRWESNANSAPATQNITLNGLDFTLDSQSVAAPDWSAVNIGTLHYGYDLKNQGDRIEFDFLTYNANYFDLTDINLNFFEATLGPSFNLRRSITPPSKAWRERRSSTSSAKVARSITRTSPPLAIW